MVCNIVTSGCERMVGAHFFHQLLMSLKHTSFEYASYVHNNKSTFTLSDCRPVTISNTIEHAKHKKLMK